MEATIQSDYETIPAFRDYVDKYAEKHEITAEEALTHELVRQIWKTYTGTGGRT